LLAYLTLALTFLCALYPISLFFSLRLPPPPRSTLFPYTTLFRSERRSLPWASIEAVDGGAGVIATVAPDHDQGSARVVVPCNAASAPGANVAHIGVIQLFGRAHQGFASLVGGGCCVRAASHHNRQQETVCPIVSVHLDIGRAT